ncbi:MAG: hypothetical protein ACR2PA_05770 [Hyphomicrobiaceae bacterium]
MTRLVKKLSGPSLHRFFKRYYRSQQELDDQQADRLANVAIRTFSSVRVRRLPPARASARAQPRTRKPKQPQTEQAVARPPVAKDEPTATTAKPFDPYSFGLVPVYQREGRDGLLTRLGDVDQPDHLRKMARAQQIALPAELRDGKIDLEVLREAIAAAVEKRIASRRAAAG